MITQSTGWSEPPRAGAVRAHTSRVSVATSAGSSGSRREVPRVTRRTKPAPTSRGAEGGEGGGKEPPGAGRRGGGGAGGGAADKAGAHEPRGVGGEGVEKVPARAAAAGWAVFDPEHGTLQLGQAVGEMVPDQLGRQIPRSPP